MKTMLPSIRSHESQHLSRPKIEHRHVGVIFYIALSLLAPCALSRSSAASIASLPNLVSIDIFEATSGINTITYSPTAGPLLTRLADPLGPGNNDFNTAEFYDFFYSNADGAFNPSGDYLSVTAVFNAGLPAGGGLNLSEIRLNFTNRTEFGSVIGSFVALGDNAAPQSVILAIDGDINTTTTMGNTIGQTDRLRVTVGFASSVPEPSSMLLIPLGVVALLRRRHIHEQNA